MLLVYANKTLSMDYRGKAIASPGKSINSVSRPLRSTYALASFLIPAEGSKPHRNLYKKGTITFRHSAQLVLIFDPYTCTGLSSFGII